MSATSVPLKEAKTTLAGNLEFLGIPPTYLDTIGAQHKAVGIGLMLCALWLWASFWPERRVGPNFILRPSDFRPASEGVWYLENCTAWGRRMGRDHLGIWRSWKVTGSATSELVQNGLSTGAIKTRGKPATGGPPTLLPIETWNDHALQNRDPDKLPPISTIPSDFHDVHVDMNDMRDLWPQAGRLTMAFWRVEDTLRKRLANLRGYDENGLKLGQK